jgi:hypothetical protein
LGESKLYSNKDQPLKHYKIIDYSPLKRIHKHPMCLIIDFHCHIYPQHNLDILLLSTLENLKNAQKSLLSESHKTSPTFILSLTERQDCNAFEMIASGELPLPKNFSLQLNQDNLSLKITSLNTGEELHIIAGQQINTSEKLELLAFACREKIPSKLTWQETFAAIRAAHGIPIINWAPGKWWFKRGKLIEEIIDQEKNFLLCDTALRPRGYPVPKLMKLAANRGIKTFFGSDPLPMSGEEYRSGNYVSFIDTTLDPTTPAQDLKKTLLLSNTKIIPIGGRLSLAGLIKRLSKYYAQGK